MRGQLGRFSNQTQQLGNTEYIVYQSSSKLKKFRKINKKVKHYNQE